MLEDILSKFKLSDNHLPALDQVLKITQVKIRVYHGVKQIELNNIIGSEGRATDFDRNFVPINENLRQRLADIRKLFEDGVHFPPISVFKIDDYYFVRDGNHRVSVAKSRRQIYIDAEITEYILDVPITKELNYKDLEIIAAHSNFLNHTGLAELGRKSIIKLSSAKSYQSLIHIIEKYIKNQKKQQNIDLKLKEGAKKWYQDVFLPFSEDAYRFDMLSHFKKKTTGDLYIWLQTNWSKLSSSVSGSKLSYLSNDKPEVENTDEVENTHKISSSEIALLGEIYTKNLKAEDNFLYSHNIAIAVINVLMHIQKPENPKIIIVRRRYHPSEGQWSLPFSMLRVDEEIQESVKRCQTNVLGMKVNYCNTLQFCIHDDKGRHPFGRVIAIGMLGIIFDFKNKLQLTAGHLADSVRLSGIDEVPNLVFDHNRIYAKALDFLIKNGMNNGVFEYFAGEEVTLKNTTRILKTITDVYDRYYK